MNYSKAGYGKRPLWHWIIIYLAIGALVYAGIYYGPLSSKSQKQAVTTITTPVTGVFNISATATGFDPQYIMIKAGQTVTWTNKASTNVVIASSPHPTHTDYPPLNLGAIDPGKTKTLSFPTAGVYKYHNHLIPTQFGSITVQ